MTGTDIRLITVLLCALLLPTELHAQPVINIEIDGLDERLEENVRLLLSIEQRKDHPLLSIGRIRSLHQRAAREIAQALEPFGYYRPEVSSSLNELDDGSWLAIYQVDPGPGIPIARFDLEISGDMQGDPQLAQLIELRGLREQEVFDHTRYEAFKSSLSGLAAERGYMDARFTRTRVEIDLNDYQARVTLHMETGMRYRFGEVSLQQEVLETELLERYITFKTGDPYDLAQLIRLQQALNDSNYFQLVEVSPGEPQSETREIPVNVRLTPRKRNQYNFGLGYGTDTGARAKFGWRMPRVNTRGHRIDTEFIVSEIGYDVSANYRVPVLNPRTDQLVYTISEEKEETDTNDSLLRIIGVSLNHGRGKWRENLSLNLQKEDFEVGSDSGISELLIPGVSWTRIWGDEFINVFDGIRFDVGMRGASENLASDTDFAQLRGALKFIVSFDARNRLLLRGGLGTTETSEFNQLPSSIRFFAGGSQSVRGYSYESLGPEDENGDVIGGRHLLTGSIEFEHYFNDRWGAAVFLDAGNAIDDFDDDLEQGAGFGMRWKSPVGPVRVDVANAISDSEDWRLHVTIGPDL